MDDLDGQVSIMGEERHLVLQLVRLCKRYEVEMMAATTSIAELQHSDLGLLERLMNRKKELQCEMIRVVDAKFRRLETAITDGTPYLPRLRELLERYQ
jgi:hypothetical protein